MGKKRARILSNAEGKIEGNYVKERFSRRKLVFLRKNSEDLGNAACSFVVNFRV